MKSQLQKSLNVKRSVRIGRHSTSVMLEEPFWKAFKEIAAIRNVHPSDLLTAIDRDRQHGNLSSAIRLFIPGEPAPDPFAREIEADIADFCNKHPDEQFCGKLALWIRQHVDRPQP
jgi:hypothetical protein